MEEEAGTEDTESSSNENLINMLSNMERDELVEYLVENLGDEINEADCEQLRKGLSNEQIEEYKKLVISALKNNDTNGTLVEENNSTSNDDDDKVVDPPDLVSTGPTDNPVDNPVVEVITLDDDDDSIVSVHDVTEVPVISDLAEGTGITRNLDNFSVSDIDADEPCLPTLRKMSSECDKVLVQVYGNGSELTTAAQPDIDQEEMDYYNLARLEKKIYKWTKVNEKENAATIHTISIPENEEEYSYQILSLITHEHDDDDDNSLDNLSLPSGGKTDFFFNDPNKIKPQRDCIVDPAKENEYCGAGLLGAKIRIGPICDTEEESSFQNIFNVIHSFERHNFKTECNLCDGEVIADQISLGRHVTSDSHRRNLIQSSLTLIGLKAKFSLSSPSKVVQLVNEEEKSPPSSLVKDASDDLDQCSINDLIDLTEDDKDRCISDRDIVREVKDTTEDMKEEQKEKKVENVQVPEQRSSKDDELSSSKLAVGKESIYSHYSSKRHPSSSNSLPRSGDARPQEGDRSTRRRSHNKKNKKRSRHSSSMESREHHRDRGSESRDRNSNSRRNSKECKITDKTKVLLTKKEERLSHSHSNISNDHFTGVVKSYKDEALPLQFQSAEAKQLDATIFNLKLTLIAHGKWTNQCEENWKQMEDAQNELKGLFGVKMEHPEEQLQADPMYATEWTKFWERRYEELVVDDNKSIAYADSYDYASEWTVEWKKIARGIIQKRYETQLQEIRLKYGMDLDTLRNMNTMVPVHNGNVQPSGFQEPTAPTPFYQPPYPAPPLGQHPFNPPLLNFPHHPHPMYSAPPPWYHYSDNHYQQSNNPRALYGMPIFKPFMR